MNSKKIRQQKIRQMSLVCQERIFERKSSYLLLFWGKSGDLAIGIGSWRYVERLEEGFAEILRSLYSIYNYY